MTAAIPHPPGPMAGADRSAPRRRARSTIDESFEAIRSDPRITCFDRLIFSILAEYCRAEGNALCWPSTATLARLAGVQATKDAGEARVLRALAKLERLGFIGRIGRHDFPEWMGRIGGPKLGLAAPRTDSSPSRFIVHWWKFPGVEPESLRPRKASVHLTPAPGQSIRPPDSGARSDLAPAPGAHLAPAPALRTSSNFELELNVESVNVNAAAPGESESPPEPVARSVEDVLAELDSNRVLWRFPVMLAGLLWELVDLGAEVPAAFRDRMPRRPTPDPIQCPNSIGQSIDSPKSFGQAPPADPNSFGPKSPATLDLIAALARTGATDHDVQVAARKLAEELDDLHSVNFHRKVLAEVRAGILPAKVVIKAYNSTRAATPESRRRLFTAAIGDAREGLTRRKETARRH